MLYGGMLCDTAKENERKPVDLTTPNGKKSSGERKNRKPQDGWEQQHDAYYMRCPDTYTSYDSMMEGMYVVRGLLCDSELRK